VRVTGLFSYPIKGCHRVAHDEAQMELCGLAGDRRFMIIDTDNRMITQRQVAELVRVRPRYEGANLILAAEQHGELLVEPIAGALVDTNVHRTPIRASLVSAAADEWLSDVLERRVRLVYLDDTDRRPVGRGTSRPEDRVSLADAYPVLLTSTSSLDALNDWLAEDGSPEWPLPMTRFRPNLVVSGAPPWAEDDFSGATLRLGEMTFRGTTVCDRCVVTTTDQDTGVRGREPLRTLARYRNVNQQLLFGLNLIPDRAGVIRLGDAVSGVVKAGEPFSGAAVGS
jgi:uncharacterized protein